MNLYEARQLYPKTIKRHLLNGGKLEDWLDGEPGMCSNGGRYYTIYRYHRSTKTVIFRSSYEDAEWDEAGFSLDQLVGHVCQTWHDSPIFYSGPRWSLA